jgi:uncharacterized integral membrane protein
MTKKNLRLAGIGVLLTILVSLLFQNSDSVTVSFISMHLQMPLFVLVTLATLLGWLIGRMVRFKK